MLKTRGAGSLTGIVRRESCMAQNAKFSVCLVALALICLFVSTSCERRSSKISRCHLNLMELELIKHDWAVENTSNTNRTPTWGDLQPYFPERWSNSIPICPAGGTYTIGPAGEKPKCSIGGGFDHSLL